ncbi:MAG: iron-containing alcohol dehydrogenase [Rubrobacteraceae bacterium]|nr:iron-containing alcohol dehydrogenase [Rubrobacteraceae bacterium]
MTIAQKLADADPTDLEGLRSSLRASDSEARLLPLGMSRIEIGDGALDSLPEAVAGVARGPGVVLVMDATPMWRGTEDLKGRVAALLAGRFGMRRAVIGTGRAALHADDEALAEAEAAVAGAGCVVVVGSGTITDVCKEATARAGRRAGEGPPPLVVVQTAASVNAFSDDMAVLLKAGTKRTVPSRWPDVLLVDLPVIADAPPAMNLAGFGDLVSMWTAPADWYLASALGMDDSYHAAPVELLRKGGRRLLDDAAGLRQRDLGALEKLARVLTLSGISLGVAGKTSPLSGTEHLISHLVDMAAEQSDLPLALHGAQVAVAAVTVASAWQMLVDHFDPSTVDPDRLFPSKGDMEPAVREAFSVIDPSGEIGEECWHDYRKKLASWHAARPRVETALRRWPEHRAKIGEMVMPPERLAGALREAGAPVRFSELDPPVGPEVARWALKNCHLMRNRFTLADLLFLAGHWNDDSVEELLERSASAGGGL